MSVGGATWDTAGALTLGTANTFDPADATESGEFGLLDTAWWTVVTDGAHVIRINASTNLAVLYSGDTYDDRVVRDAEFDDTGSLYTLPPGTYHYLVGHFGAAPAEYVVTYELAAPLTHTGWLTTFRDCDDNQIIVSNESNTRNENPWLEWRTSQSWYDTVLNGASGQQALGRRGHYNIQGELPGWTSLLSGADACAWAHAVNGDQGAGNTFWNTSTTDPDDSGPPTCRPLGENSVDEETVTQPYRVLQYTPWAFPTAGAMYAEVRHATLTPAFRFAEANVQERGALPLSLADPTADGVPAAYVGTAVLEWEPGGVELVSIEASGDANGADIDPADAVTFLINPTGAPAHTGGGTYSAWPKGIPTSADSIHYEDGLDWNALPFSSFDDVADDGPDMVVVASLDVTLDDAAPDFREVFGVGKLAYRFTFRSPRYRWTWVEPPPATRPSPVRVIGRKNDGLVRSGTQTIRRNTAQHSIRTLGAQR